MFDEVDGVLFGVTSGTADDLMIDFGGGDADNIEEVVIGESPSISSPSG